MRQHWLAGMLALAVVACGQSGGNNPDPPLYTPSPSPTASIRPTSVALTGKIYVAANNDVDSSTQLPQKYQLAPDGAQVSVRAKGTSRWKTVTTQGGSYTFEVMANTPLEVMASCSGCSSRVQDFTPTATSQTLNFEAKNKSYLVDCPEVVSVTPLPSQKIDPGKRMTFTIKFSEQLDPASFDPEAISLTSTDIEGLAITQRVGLNGASASVTFNGDTVVLSIAGPVRTLPVRGNNYPLVNLGYGKGVFKERASGAILNPQNPQAVSGYTLDGKRSLSDEGIPLRFWTDDVAPSLLSVTAQNGQLRMLYSEPMVVMLNAESATGSYDPAVLSPLGYSLVASTSAETGALPVVTLANFQFDQSNPNVVLCTLSVRGTNPLSALTITALTKDPAGNPINAASSSVTLRF